ncbi:MAG TPA: O-antigen translocase [Allosphingosinicella sp.]
MASSHRQILRSSTIVGGATVVNLVVGVARQKVLALALGPAGVGTVGLMQGLVATAAAAGGMGLSSAGTRQIADAAGSGSEERLALARKALVWLTSLLALCGALLLWLLREPLAVAIFGTSAAASGFAMLGLAVALTIVGASQFSLLVGMQRIGDVARLTVFSALASTLIGVGAILAFGSRAILFFVVSAPLAAALFGLFYTKRLPAPVRAPRGATALLGNWQAMLSLGIATMLAGLITTATQLVGRTLVQRQLGAADLGAFQAASVITVTYLGLVLQAMSTDYYPRLTRAVGDPPTANRLVNEQTEVTLLLGGPVLLCVIGGAPWIVRLLYSSAFAGAADLLRIQIFGDTLRLASWPLGYLLLARGSGRSFVAAEATGNVAFLAILFALLGPIGLPGAGLAVVGMYLAYLPVVYFVGRRQSGFRWTREVLVAATVLLSLNVAVYALARLGDLPALAAGCLAAAGFGVFAVHRLRAALPERAAAVLEPFYRQARRLLRTSAQREEP